jgi:thioesterase domain-containing protein
MEGAPYGSLAELAAGYVRDLRERQARGPYRLCGWSFGGVVAFEMAAQLVTAGEPVAFLSLLDARLHVPGAPSLFAADEDQLGAFLRDYEIDHIGEPSPDRPARALAEGKRRGILPPWLTLDDLVEMAARYGAAFRHNIGLARTYTPSARVPRMLVVEAADRRGLPAAAASWRPWVDVVEHTEVPGDHFSVLRPPQVDAVASIVAAHLSSPRTSVLDEQVRLGDAITRTGRGVL